MGQHHGTQGRGDEQRTRHLEDPDVAAEDQLRHPGDVADLAVDRTDADRVAEGDPPDGSGEDAAEAQAEDRGHPALAGQGLHEAVGGVDADEHDDDEEQHHDGAGVDEDLDDTEEVGTLGDVEDAEDDHRQGHAERRVDGLLGKDQTEGAQDREGSEHPEEHLLTGAGHEVTSASVGWACSATYARCASVAADTFPR